MVGKYGSMLPLLFLLQIQMEYEANGLFLKSVEHWVLQCYLSILLSPLARSLQYIDAYDILQLLSEVTKPCWTCACCSVSTAFGVLSLFRKHWSDRFLDPNTLPKLKILFLVLLIRGSLCLWSQQMRCMSCPDFWMLSFCSNVLVI